MAKKKEPTTKRGKYDEKLAVNVSFIDLIDATLLDAKNGNFKKRAAKSKKAKE
jgi:hypothetical protein